MRPALIAVLLLGCGGRAAPCPDGESTLVPTADGAAISLHHHPADGPPVLLVHGVSSNHRFMDLSPERSLAQTLQAAGLDAWTLDLRGHGDATTDASGASQRAGWTMDDYGRYDIPAAIDWIRGQTGASSVGYVGHSMGGMVGAIYQAIHGDDALSSLIIISSPVDFSDPGPLLRLGQTSMVAGQLLRSVPSAGVARSARRLRRLPLGVDDLLLAPGSTSPAAREEIYGAAVSPLSQGELHQLGRILHAGRFVSNDGTLDYGEALASLSTPLLVIAGRGDQVASPDRVHAWIPWSGSEEKEWLIAGRANGFSFDYGHVDILLGDTAPAEVYPPIAGWLLAHPPAHKTTLSVPSADPAG